MTSQDRVHMCPPAGSVIMPCCGGYFGTVTLDDFTTDEDEVTCNVRAVAELVCDQDDGESPFGWRENVVRDRGRAPVLASALRAVRRQCPKWAGTTSPVTWAFRTRSST